MLLFRAKNIPIASERNYKMQLIDKIEAVIKRMRWKAIFFDDTIENEENDSENEETFDTFGLKTPITPKQVPELAEFEKDLIDIVRNIKFRKGMNNFQSKLKQDLRSINESEKLYIPADKTTNMYKMEKNEYDRILKNSVTSTYKKADPNLKRKIDSEGKELVKEHRIADRLDVNGKNNCFVTLKDHKDNFLNNPATRLINPAKNEIGRLSKKILENINKTIRESLELNQWKSTTNVIDWFKTIRDKEQHTFMMLDIKDFYPSIKEKLLKNALHFASNICPISQQDKELIYHSRKSLLFTGEESWIKKGNKLFDVTMGAYDGAEVCELIGCFLLSKIAEKYTKNDIGLYRDDGLAIFKNTNGQQNEKIKKDFHRLFRKHDLEIVAACNMKVVNYLDVTLDLASGTFRPYRKPDNEVNYVHVQSNHPPAIIKQIPYSIQTRLSNLSSNEAIFQEALPHYEEALKRSGYNHKFEYTPSQNQHRYRRTRKRNIIWFNPPYNINVATNIGKYFLSLIKKHFPRNHKFYRIFNKNNVKVSYSCMPNVKSFINGHNKKITSPPQAENHMRGCNCRNKDLCPLSKNCAAASLVYEATVSADLPNYAPTKYIGLCEPSFKKRYAVHKTTFNHQKYRTDTTVAAEYWRIKDKNGNPKVSWRKIRHAPGYSVETKKCLLCLTEKLEIANYPGKNLLNKRTEIIAKCRHRKKHELLSLGDVTED